MFFLFSFSFIDILSALNRIFNIIFCKQIYFFDPSIELDGRTDDYFSKSRQIHIILHALFIACDVYEFTHTQQFGDCVQRFEQRSTKIYIYSCQIVHNNKYVFIVREIFDFLVLNCIKSLILSLKTVQSNAGHTGLYNLGNTCYVNCVLQLLRLNIQ